MAKKQRIKLPGWNFRRRHIGSQREKRYSFQGTAGDGNWKMIPKRVIMVYKSPKAIPILLRSLIVSPPNCLGNCGCFCPKNGWISLLFFLNKAKTYGEDDDQDDQENELDDMIPTTVVNHEDFSLNDIRMRIHAFLHKLLKPTKLIG